MKLIKDKSKSASPISLTRLALLFKTNGISHKVRVESGWKPVDEPVYLRDSPPRTDSLSRDNRKRGWVPEESSRGTFQRNPPEEPRRGNWREEDDLNKYGFK